MNKCLFAVIQHNITNACEFVKEHCDNSYIPFLDLHYCHFSNNYFITIPIMVIILFACFYLLSDTSNRYLSPALTILSDKLGMSQNLAGVTFLALGNGAPDVISSIVAGEEDFGLEFSIGALFGAGVFVTCIVLSSVVLFSGSVTLKRELFIRDVILYIAALFILFIFSLRGSISLFEAIGFFSLYIM
jgi:sodium/potassium/calcium exchanger 6